MTMGKFSACRGLRFVCVARSKCRCRKAMVLCSKMSNCFTPRTCREQRKRRWRPDAPWVCLGLQAKRYLRATAFAKLGNWFVECTHIDERMTRTRMQMSLTRTARHLFFSQCVKGLLLAVWNTVLYILQDSSKHKLPVIREWWIWSTSCAHGWMRRKFQSMLFG